jgi:hypothetical protein
MVNTVLLYHAREWVQLSDTTTFSQSPPVRLEHRSFNDALASDAFALRVPRRVSGSPVSYSRFDDLF